MYDGNDKLNPEEIRAKIEGGDSESLEIILGTLEGDRKGELLDKLSLVVMSPGVPTDLPIVNEMREKGLPIWGDHFPAWRNYEKLCAEQLCGRKYR